MVFFFAETLGFFFYIFFVFILKADAHLVFHLTAGHCYAWQLSPFPEVLQALVPGNVESSPASVQLFRTVLKFFLPLPNALFFQVRLKRVTKY